MKFTGTYNGKPIELELTEEQVEVLKKAEKKKTGWERAEEAEGYWVCDGKSIIVVEEENLHYDDDLFSYANYFTSDILAENISRAQALQRKLWRRSAELCEKIDWKKSTVAKFGIYYNHDVRELRIDDYYVYDCLGQVLFDTRGHARQAIEEFHDELIWYFTEFQSRMD